VTMTGVDAHVIRFQCPQCGHDLEQSIGDLKSSEHMRCPGCGVGINIDTNRLANAAEELQKAIDKVPPRDHDQVLPLAGADSSADKLRPPRPAYRVDWACKW